MSEKQQQLLKQLRSFDSEVEAAYQFSQQFVKMVRELGGEQLSN